MDIWIWLTLLRPADPKLCAPEPQVLQNERPLHHQSGPQVSSVGAYTVSTHLSGLDTPDQHTAIITCYSVCAWTCTHTWGLRLVSRRRICPWKQGQGKHFSFTGKLPLHSHQSTQLRQRQDAFGHQLITDIWIVVSAETKIQDKNIYCRYTVHLFSVLRLLTVWSLTCLFKKI